MSISIKTPTQIEGIRKSCKLAADTLKYLEQFVVAGATTISIDEKCEAYIRKNGGIPATIGYSGYQHSSCISPNEVICHGVPNNTVLKDGDIVNIDVITQLDGYFGDTCKMYKVGNVSEENKQLIEVTNECLKIGIKECYPGNRIGNIGYEINKYATLKGYGVVYEFCGHGVGLQIHEQPEVAHVARRNSGAKMKPGMIFTIEPMINIGKSRAKIDREDGWTARTIDSKNSAQFEHTILITENGCELLTDIYNDF